MNHLKLYEQFDFEDFSDEELFGEEPEEPKVGDKVLVLPELRAHVNENHWSSSMLEMIGRELYIKGIDDDTYVDRETRYFLDYPGHNFYVYRDCFEII